MALNSVKFIIQKGGLGINFPNEDHVSGLIFLGVSPPSQFQAAAGLEFTSLEQAEQKGIVKAGPADPVYKLAWHYTKEYFRISNGASLYIVFTSQTTIDPDMVFGVTKGRVRRFGFVTNDVPTDLPKVQTFCNEMFNREAPCVAILGTFSGEEGLPDLAALNAPQVGVVVAGSYSAITDELEGDLALETITEPSNVINCIPAVGTVLGILSRGGVNEAISWVGQNRIDGDGEFETIKFADGGTLEDKLLAALNGMTTKRYLFPVNYVGIPGAYFNKSYTAITPTDDFNNLENNQVIQKAIRNVRTALLPQLDAPVLLDSVTGRLRESTVRALEALGDRGLQDLDLNDEISGGKVKIDANQNILSTNKLMVTIQIVPTGKSEQIEVSIGLVGQISI